MTYGLIGCWDEGGVKYRLRQHHGCLQTQKLLVLFVLATARRWNYIPCRRREAATVSLSGGPFVKPSAHAYVVLDFYGMAA